ncbi:VapE domain-containing protein [Paraglaciecola hydrolytica]|uniref:Virulence-associated protein E-like domain-containing protein n=1 Tax=Paraglaciecola hydrolytica TaxID=1799789 RepID=A0A148KLT5_9ALTE|nr:VapE domain-containing protein [Paraglaciecola hydrolytica]KXI27208.1 hypothetical protein AX660_01175 [Paraglaciecola hydrolytica]
MNTEQPIQLTIFTSDDGPLNKSFFLEQTGQIKKTSNAFLKRGKAKRHHLANLGDLESLVLSLNDCQCLSTGAFKSEDVMISSIPNQPNTLKRSKDNMHQPPVALILLDFDYCEDMPQDWNVTSPEDLISLLRQNVPVFQNIEFLATPSSSSLVRKIDCDNESSKKGFHLYFVSENADLHALKEFLEVKLWNAGLGYIKLARNGALLPRTLFDLSVLSQERLIFEALPTVGDGLELQERRWFHSEGERLTQLTDLSEQEIEQFKTVVDAAKATPDVQPRSETLKQKYLTDLSEQQAKLTGCDSNDILKELQATYKSFEFSNQNLDSDFIIDTGTEYISVEDLLVRFEEFDNNALPDPIEGRSYGTTCAKFYYNKGEKPLIKSFAHGQDTFYFLTNNKAVLQVIQANANRVPVEIFPDIKTSQGSTSIPPTMPNLAAMLDYYKIRLWYDELSKNVQIELPSHLPNRDNAHATKMAIIRSLAIYNSINNAALDSFIDALAWQRPVNPVRDALDKIAWDGSDRISELFLTLRIAEGFSSKLAFTLLKRWLISVVACMYEANGFHCRGVLTFQGPQSIGKTAWIRKLLPVYLANYIKIDHHLDASNKDSILIALSHLIVEIGELDSSFRKDIARLKGFLTADRDKIRRPYGRYQDDYQRRTVFCATVNHGNFLVDDTGNSRWWTIPVISIDYDHRIDVLQLWAQVRDELYKQNEKWWLSQDEEKALNDSNLNFRSVSTIQDKVFSDLDWNAPEEKWSKQTATQVLQDLGYERPSNNNARECGAALRERLGESKKIGGNRVWLCPPTKVPKLVND